MSSYTYNIFCDESCHLENDKSNVMLLGAVMCKESNKKKHYEFIRQLKMNHGMSSWNEIKWVKVSQNKCGFYDDLLSYFFKSDDLQFRVIVMNKINLNHKKHGNTHDTWYYHMYYYLLEPLVKVYGNNVKYKVFLDIKDTNGGRKIEELANVLRRKKGVRVQEAIDIKQIRSHESELLQLNDLLIGAVGYYHRGLYKGKGSSSGKNHIVFKIINEFGINFDQTTRRSEEKFNLFLWKPREV